MKKIDLITELNEIAKDKEEEILAFFNETVKFMKEREAKEKKYGKPLTEIMGMGRPPVGGLNKSSQHHLTGGSDNRMDPSIARSGEYQFHSNRPDARQSAVADKLGANELSDVPEVGEKVVVNYHGKRYPANVSFAQDGIYGFKPAMTNDNPISVNAADLHFQREENGRWSVNIFKK